ncbi:hypothetical protein C8R45DRAFT_7153 [Mycena sanguinolenta]|nr:hypothetical protein C8R45DRAFT_7153 [Mycena sanguinolenta]
MRGKRLLKFKSIQHRLAVARIGTASVLQVEDHDGMAFHSYNLDTLREGPVTVKKAGLLSSWRGWTDKWMVLNARSLTIYKNQVHHRFIPGQGIRISLNSITRLERTHSSRKGHCLLLDAAGTRYLLACRSDDDLYDWHDLVYAYSPLMLFRATAESEEIDLESIIRGYSSNPDLSSQPSTPRTLPHKTQGKADPYPSSRPPLFRSQTHSPAASNQLLVDLADVQDLKAPVSDPIATSSNNSSSLRPGERELIRKAVSLLCDVMEPRLLRKSEPGGEKPFDLVEIRLRPLSRIKRRWGKHEIPDAEEIQTFADALRDGYVLCQLLNTLHSSPVVRPDVRGQDDNSSVNITKFLAACTAHGLASTELFVPRDVVEASGYSLGRVASTIIGLVQFSETALSPRTAPKPLRAATPVDDQLPAAQRAAEDLEEWVEPFIALTRQKMISDQVDGIIPDNLESLIEPFTDSKV